MDINDLSKDVQRLLLEHWSKKEIADHLQNPEYFFDQLVVPRLDYLRRSGEDAPRLRTQLTPTGDLRVILLP